MYAAKAGDQVLTFDVECVWRRNMIIRDRQTGTLWQHATGEALVGPLQGVRLDLLGGYLMTWAAWRGAYPNTLVALQPAWTGLLPLVLTVKVLETATSGKVPPGINQPDRRLPDHDFVIGIEVSGTSRAYPLNLLRELTTLEECFGGSTIRVTYEEKDDHVRVYQDDIQIQHQRTKWLGWHEFHPTTSVYEPE